MAEGYLNKCKICARRDSKERAFGPKRQEILAKARARGNNQSPEYLKEFRKRYPYKYKAHLLVSNSIRDGKMKKQPCEICGVSERIHAHHDDYSKPLDVRWLCAEHHRQWHSEHGEGKF